MLTALDRYCQEWRHIQAALNGDDLHQLGLRRGTIYRTVLTKRTCSGRLDGTINSREEEEAFVRRIAHGRARQLKIAIWRKGERDRCADSCQRHVNARTELSAATACSQYTYFWLEFACASTSCTCSNVVPSAVDPAG